MITIMVKKIKFLLFILMFSFCMFSFAQKTIPNSFEITENTSKYSKEFITESILKANFETYRDKNLTTKIKISNGFSIELISAKQLFILNNSVQMEKYSSGSNLQSLNLELMDNGFFIQKVANVSNPKKKSIKK